MISQRTEPDVCSFPRHSSSRQQLQASDGRNEFESEFYGRMCGWVLCNDAGVARYSRVVNVLDSGAEGPGFKSAATLSGDSLRQTVHTHCASVHQAAKLVAAFLRVTGVTAGLAESNGSLPPGS